MAHRGSLIALIGLIALVGLLGCREPDEPSYDLEALRERLKTPPDGGGIWGGPKVARWSAARRGLVHVHAPRGWEALKKIEWSIQVPRPRNPKAAPPEEQAAFKKSLPRPSPRRPRSTPPSRASSGQPTSTGSA